MNVIIEQTPDLFTDGEHPAVIKYIEEESRRDGEPQVHIKFSLLEELSGYNAHAWVPRIFSPRFMTYELVKIAMGGGPIPEDMDFNSDELIGMKVNVVVKWIKGGNGPYFRVDDVKPFNP